MATKKSKTEITTNTGFTCLLDPNVGDDMEVMDNLQRLGRGEMMDLTMAELIDKMIGTEQREKLYNHCRTNGRVSMRKVVAEADDILGKAVDTLKKV